MVEKNRKFFFYVLYCADGTLYGGFTVDLAQRVATHNAGKGAKYTRVKSRRPVRLIYSETYETKHDALSAEYHFKHQTRKAKLQFLDLHNVKLPKV
ncbi:putative endonuclease containing a URI domain [Pediococcus damnosus]|uniref:Endonuclease containing a URI domain n=1 Tax=Pediococcus damnosus TaxID=51663 RepID=A0A0R2HG61_9LACO|nr:GIY-YIG nuclease family protein [Pediococcus damnosus]AMV61631.1 putative endonuclease containing a URI domain [Pediococcus damnosus]AMV62007.1 putative endonuclease containing a URI domain [Pediococcus damnosus]AMV65993.1 putative endonuclease containing a URI domain [Pediococcus damnosus]AMV68142.1 putative endonuclease containing a URI domain [Pediococcus damnosus]AMV70328.1 putative endonuclease containing a URI domain [Pediococcus damnosus]